MVFVARFARGKASYAVHISYRGLVKYRAALMFWALRSHQKRNLLPPIPTAKFFNQLTEAMRAATKKYGLTVVGSLNRTTVGLPELRQLIDLDAISTPCIEVAEEHHLAWCIGRVCSVRPGSIGPSGKGDKLQKGLYLTWRDINITRGEKKGEFSAGITFRSVKTNSEDPERATMSGGNKFLICNIQPPKRTDNLVFAVPHRLLVIALRRGFLVNICTLDELLEGEQYHILIKEEHLDQPVVLASGPRGLKTSDKPCAAAKLTSYLQLRGKRLGYEKDITFYSIRRRGAQDLAQLLGPDMARIIMGHDADSRTLERYYVDLLAQTDLNATLLAEPKNAEQTKNMVEENATLALNALSHTPESIKRLHDPALNALVRKMIAADEHFPIGGSDREKKNYRRQVSHVAFKVLLSEEVQKQRRSLKRSDFDSRVQILKSSNFVDVVLKRARDSLKPGPSVSSVVALPGIQDDGEFEEDNYQEPAEPDLEDMLRDGNEISRVTDETNEKHDVDEEVPYEAAVRAFMEVLLENSMNEYVDLLNNPTPCELCEEDDSVPSTQKEKLYKNKSHLLQHMESFFHSKRARWMRNNQKQHDESGDEFWYCPYCLASDVDNLSNYVDQNSMMAHIQASTRQSSGETHDTLKADDGWYDEEWAGVNTETRKRRHSEEKSKVDRRILRRYNLQYSNAVELLKSTPHPNIPGVVLGGPPHPESRSIPDHLIKFISFVRPEIVKGYEIPEAYKGFIKYAHPGDEIEKIDTADCKGILSYENV